MFENIKTIWRAETMNVLFKEIRQGNIENIRERIEKNPAVVNEVFTGKKPLKDIGQSPLQVALKCAEFDIIDLLLNNGADPDFIENPSQVPPGSMCCPVISDAIKYAMDTLLYTGTKHIEQSLRYVGIIERLLVLGADPNKKRIDKNPINNWQPLGVLAARGNYILKRTRSDDPEAYCISNKNIITILDLLIKYGADVEDWLDNGVWGDESNRKAYLDDFEIKDEVDFNREIRTIFQEYFNITHRE